MLTPSDISKRLADRAADVARHLLPGGKREGAEWRAGDASGEKGKSLGVHLVFVWLYYGAKWPALRIAREHQIGEAKVRETLKLAVGWVDSALERFRESA